MTKLKLIATTLGLFAKAGHTDIENNVPFTDEYDQALPSVFFDEFSGLNDIPEEVLHDHTHEDQTKSLHFGDLVEDINRAAIDII